MADRCEHYAQANDQITPNTKECEECEKCKFHCHTHNFDEILVSDKDIYLCDHC